MPRLRKNKDYYTNVHTPYRQPLNLELAFQKYVQWCETDDKKALDECFLNTLPLLSYTHALNKTFLFTERVEKCDFLQDAACNLYLKMRRKRLCYGSPSPTAKTFFYSVIDTVKWYFIKLKRDALPDRTDFSTFVDLCLFGRFPSFSDVEAKLSLESMVDIILNDFQHNIRFDGNRKNACLYILNQLLENQPISSDIIMRKYEQQDYQFLVDYVVVMLRHILFKAKKLVGFGGDKSAWREAVSLLSRAELDAE